MIVKNEKILSIFQKFSHYVEKAKHVESKNLSINGRPPTFGNKTKMMILIPNRMTYNCHHQQQPQSHLFRCIFLVLFILYVCPASSEMEYFPGLRRPPNWAQSQAADEANDILAQIIEEQARRKFQQQLAQQHYYQFHHQRGPNAQNHQNPVAPSFTYSFSENMGQSQNNDDNMPFAVNPSDPRYYETIAAADAVGSSSEKSLKSNSEENDYHRQYNNHHQQLQQQQHRLEQQHQQQQQHQHQQQDLNARLKGNVVPYSRLKPPMEINPKMPSLNNNLGARNDINALVDKLEREGQASAVINDGNIQQRNDVIKKHMGIEGEMGMYVVALIAGVSAAITVGLIALGIGWYTLQKRTKAAADVEYPAYGVTGPNKDISPSGDRRLAQSAQMYHYQHQKQQIIAMENRTTGEHTGGISDVESDDDNDEGDYTVYECPGLAPTGEMEVKNPLFLDDTPVTPSNNSAVIDGQQPQPQQQQQQIPSQLPLSKQGQKKTTKTPSQSNKQSTQQVDKVTKKPSGK